MISSYRTALFLFASLLLTGCPSDSSEPDNMPPEIQLLVEKTEYQEGEVISIAALASDEDSDELQISWAILDAPSQVTLEKISDYEVQLIVTTPLEQNALVTIQVSVSDGSNELSRQAQISISQNLQPQISYDADMHTFQLGEELSFPVTVSDEDSDNLTLSWSLKDSPAGYGISSDDGVVQLTAPAFIEQSVSLTALLHVSDGYNSVDKEFSVTITPNFVPLVTAEAESYTFQLGEELSFPVTVSDSDSDNLAISWALKGSPAGYGISSSGGVVQLTAPASIEESVSLTALLHVSDGYNSLGKEFSVTITPNSSPLITAEAESYTFQLGEELSFPVTVSDDDSDNLTLSWSLKDSPAGYGISSSDGVVHLTAPAFIEQSVSLTALLKVSDGYNALTKEFSVTITPNFVPLVTAEAESYTFQLGEELSFPVTVSDSDSDSLAISWALKGSPAGYGISSSDGVVQLTAPTSIEENVSLTALLHVSDGYNALTKEFSVTITPNFAPIITAEAESYTFQLGEELSFPVTVSDDDSDNLTISWALQNSPSGFGISSSGGVVQLTAPDSIEQSINLTALLQVSDGYNSLDKEFSITIQPKDLIRVSLVYPPANALTDASSTIVRGESSSALSSLSINGVAVTSDDNFLSWTASLPIGVLETLSMVPESSVQVTEKVEYENFDRTIKNTQPFLVENESLTAYGDMVYLIDSTTNKIIQQNNITNERRVVFHGTIDFDFEPEQAIVDDVNHRLVVAGTLVTADETYGLTVVAFDLTSFEKSVLFQDTQYEAFQSIAFNGDNNKLLIPDWHSKGSIFEIDLTTGVKTLLYSATGDFGIELNRGYIVKHHKGDILWAEVGSPKLHRINQATDQMSLVWQEDDYQAEIDALDISLRLFEEFIYDEDNNKLTLITYAGIIIFDLTDVTIESYVSFASLFDTFVGVEKAYVLDREVYIWDEDTQLLTSYNLDSGEYSSTGNDTVNIGLADQPRNIGLSADEKSFFYSSNETPAMYQFPIDATDAGELEVVFDLSINNADEANPDYYFEPYVHINQSESGFYMNKQYDNGGLHFFEFDTQNITTVSLIEDVEVELVIDFANNLAYTATDNTTYDFDANQWIYEVIWKKVDLETGTTTDISSNQDYIGTEFEYRHFEALTISPDGSSLIVGHNDNLLSIDISNGEHSWLSKDKLMPNLPYSSIQNFIWVNDELYAINANEYSGLYQVNQSTGDFTELSGRYAGSGVTPFDFDNGVYSPSLQQFFILDVDLEAIYAIDELTGERLIIHK